MGSSDAHRNHITDWIPAVAFIRICAAPKLLVWRKCTVNPNYVAQHYASTTVRITETVESGDCTKMLPPVLRFLFGVLAGNRANYATKRKLAH